MPQTFSQLHPNLWVAQSEVYTTNSAIFLNETAACLVDPAVLPEDLRGIQGFLNEQRLKPDNMVITHYHWDHLFGPEYFPNVRVIAHQASQAVQSGPDADRVYDHVKRFDAEYRVRRIRPFRIPPAEIVFQSGITVQVGELPLQVIHTPGHSPDQCVIYQPQEGILWAADMLSDLEIPFVYEDLAHYQVTLEKLRKLDVSLLIPGHGHFTADASDIEQRFEEDMAYLEELRQRVQKAVQAGETLEETQVGCKKMRFRHADDNAAPHRLNVEIAYNRMLAAAG